MDLLKKFEDEKLIQPPYWLTQNVQYCVMMGSEAYGVSSNSSDIDLYGYCMPPKYMIFPHLAGEIPGFGNQLQRFEQYQQHHVIKDTKEYDVTIYSIVKFFQLCMENNPNMLSALNVPNRCVLFMSNSAAEVRRNRDKFLHKGSYGKFRGYAYSQLSKLKNNSNSPKRKEDIEKFGYSTKFAYHIVRLALECEQILTEHTLDVERNSEILKSIRRGEWTIEKLFSWFDNKEKSLETMFANSSLREKPDQEYLKNLLLYCIEDHYGSVSSALQTSRDVEILNEMKQIIEKYSK